MTSAVMMFAMLVAAGSSGSTTDKCPEIIAHRGESSLAPENTLAAFNLAWRHKADAVELDVHLTSDGHLVVIHDPDTERMTGQKLVVAKSTLAELRKLTVGRSETDQKIPLLSEALKTIPEKRRLFIEVKVGPESVPVLRRDIEASGKRPEQIVVISFHAGVVAEVKRTMPNYQALWLVGFKCDKKTKQWSPTVEEVLAKARAIKADGVDLQGAAPLDRSFVEKLQKAGFQVYAWTIDSPKIAGRLVDCGVVGITTNRAGWMREQWKKRRQNDSERCEKPAVGSAEK